MITTKDYVAIGGAISYSMEKLGQYDSACQDMAKEIAEQIGVVLAFDNPRFDRSCWLNACNLNQGE